MNNFIARCVGYTQNREKYFTIGKEYEICDGQIISDNGFKYSKDPKMTQDSNPRDWYLSDWYIFEIIDDSVTPEQFEISFDDIFEGVSTKAF